MEHAGSLIEYVKYVDSAGDEKFTRVAPGTMRWMITAKNKKTYVISFENNFAKKHLYTESKKSSVVLQEAKKLWDALTEKDRKAWWWKGYWLSYPPEILVKAQKIVDEAKFKRQLGHRSALEGDICSVCRHPLKSHKTGSGHWRACKYKAIALGPECGCNVMGAYVSEKPYHDKRVAQGKPIPDPLAGARTNINTIIVMNKIPADKMKEVISDAIIAKEAELGLAGNPWGHGHIGLDADCELVSLDFGVPLTGCVMLIEAGKTYEQWDKHRGVKVKIKDLHSTDATKPTYSIVHYDDVI
jgi:hypothetical protein